MKALKLAAAGAMLFVRPGAPAGATFDSIKNKGFVQCGVSTGVSGLSANDSKGDWVGLDVDLCRAIAITLFGDASKAKILSISALQRFTALQSGEVDVLTRNTTLADARHHAGPDRRGRELLRQPGHHGEQVPERQKRQGLDGATVCVQPGTTTELNLADWFRSQGIAFKPVVVERLDEIIRSFAVGRCDAFTGDKSQLAARSTGQSRSVRDPAENFSRNRSARWCARATSSGSTSCAGPCTP